MFTFISLWNGIVLSICNDKSILYDISIWSSFFSLGSKITEVAKSRVTSLTYYTTNLGILIETSLAFLWFVNHYFLNADTLYTQIIKHSVWSNPYDWVEMFWVKLILPCLGKLTKSKKAKPNMRDLPEHLHWWIDSYSSQT